MEERLPIGPDEWTAMAAEHGEEYPYRDKDSLKRKYMHLHRVEMPTGDPGMSEEVRLVKRVKTL